MNRVLTYILAAACLFLVSCKETESDRDVFSQMSRMGIKMSDIKNADEGDTFVCYSKAHAEAGVPVYCNDGVYNQVRAVTYVSAKNCYVVYSLIKDNGEEFLALYRKGRDSNLTGFKVQSAAIINGDIVSCIQDLVEKEDGGVATENARVVYLSKDKIWSEVEAKKIDVAVRGCSGSYVYNNRCYSKNGELKGAVPVSASFLNYSRNMTPFAYFTSPPVSFVMLDFRTVMDINVYGRTDGIGARIVIADFSGSSVESASGGQYIDAESTFRMPTEFCGESMVFKGLSNGVPAFHERKRHPVS